MLEPETWNSSDELVIDRSSSRNFFRCLFRSRTQAEVQIATELHWSTQTDYACVQVSLKAPTPRLPLVRYLLSAFCSLHTRNYRIRFQEAPLALVTATTNPSKNGTTPVSPVCLRLSLTFSTPGRDTGTAGGGDPDDDLIFEDFARLRLKAGETEA